MMKILNKVFILSLLLISFSACEKDFATINQNPFNPTQTDIGPLFNNVIASLPLGWNEQFYMHNETLYGITQQAALTQASFQNISIGTDDMWNNYYTALAHIREIEKRLDEMEIEEEALNNVRAQLKIITAYKTFRLTDLFGDIPFFDAGKGFQNLEFARPKFDKQEDIYKFLLNDLAWAVENINLLPDAATDAGTAYLSFDNFDTFFGGDLNRWIKFANSLRLRHALRMADKDIAFAQPILEDIFIKNLPLIESGEDVVMMPNQQGWLRESCHWSFREHNKLRMGSNIWLQLSENDEPNGSGIYDPRAWLFFDTNNDSEWVAYPQIADNNTAASGGDPYGGVRDVNYSVKGNGNIYSSFNYYLIRDENTIPEIILTAAEVHFAKAECYMRGLGVAADVSFAEAEYTIGVVSSIEFWQTIKTNSSIWEVGMPNLSQGEIFAVTNRPEISIFDTQDKLNFIYKQRWIDAFRQPWEAFSLLRRTNAVPREGPTNDFNRFLYPPSEIEGNPDNYNTQVSSMSGGDSHQTKIWWMQ